MGATVVVLEEHALAPIAAQGDAVRKAWNDEVGHGAF
jgi:hypothetical protein